MAATTNNRILPYYTRHFFQARIALIVCTLVFLLAAKLAARSEIRFLDLSQYVAHLFWISVLLISDIKQSRRFKTGEVKTPPLVFSEKIGLRDDYRRLRWAGLGFAAAVATYCVLIPCWVVPEMPVVAWIVVIPLFNWFCWELASWLGEMVRAVHHYKRTVPMTTSRSVPVLPTGQASRYTTASPTAPVMQNLTAGKNTRP
jgi:hypothetical protein